MFLLVYVFNNDGRLKACIGGKLENNKLGEILKRHFMLVVPIFLCIFVMSEHLSLNLLYKNNSANDMKRNVVVIFEIFVMSFLSLVITLVVKVIFSLYIDRQWRLKQAPKLSIFQGWSIHKYGTSKFD